MTAHVVHQFVEATTARGPRAFYSAYLSQVTRLVVVHDGVDALFTHVISRTAVNPVIAWHSAVPGASLRGVWFPSLREAWIDPEIWRHYAPAYGPEVVHVSSSRPATPYPDCVERSAVSRFLQAAHAFLTDWGDGGWFERLPALEQMVRQLPPHSGPGRDEHYFGSPLTGQGPQSFLPDRFAALAVTIHLGGWRSRDKFQVIRRLGEIALCQGYRVEFYHDTLDPAAIDHIILPEAGWGITNATSPHHLPSGQKAFWYDPPQSKGPSEDCLTGFYLAYSEAWRQLWSEAPAGLSHLTVPLTMPSVW